LYEKKVVGLFSIECIRADHAEICGVAVVFTLINNEITILDIKIIVIEIVLTAQFFQGARCDWASFITGSEIVGEDSVFFQLASNVKLFYSRIFFHIAKILGDWSIFRRRLAQQSILAIGLLVDFE